VTQPIAEAASSRLRLATQQDPARLDGAWWPSTHDLAAELVQLAEMLPARLGGIVHAYYSKPLWRATPRWIVLRNGRQVRTGVFIGTADPNRVLLRMSSRRSLRLMVVPPSLPADLAAWAMAAASSAANRGSASDLLAAAWAHQVS
jgi:hypothetical protein